MPYNRRVALKIFFLRGAFRSVPLVVWCVPPPTLRHLPPFVGRSPSEKTLRGGQSVVFFVGSDFLRSAVEAVVGYLRLCLRMAFRSFFRSNSFVVDDRAGSCGAF